MIGADGSSEGPMVVGFGGQTRRQMAAGIAAGRDRAPDFVFEVGHGGCGSVECRRSDGPVKIAVTWLDPATAGGNSYKAFVHDGGLPVCGQTLRRAKSVIDGLARRRSADGDGVAG